MKRGNICFLRMGTACRFLLVLLVIIGLMAGYNNSSFATGSAKTLKVPSDYNTIQSAIDAASPGDIVLVNAGKYKENIKLKEGVILRGAGTDATTIDGGGNGNVVEGAKMTVIEGFTITNSGSKGKTGDTMDVGISANNAPMTIANCRITGNNAGIRVLFSPSNIVNNVVSNNKVHGIYVFYSDATVKNNIIYNNESYGIYNAYSKPEIVNNTIFNNFDGIYSEVSRVVIRNSIIIKNSSSGIRWAETPDAQESVEPVLSHNLVWGNKMDYNRVSPSNGDISKDPLFLDIAKGDVRLKKGSPAIDAGEGSEKDPDGTRSDIGAFGGSMAQKEIPLSPSLVSYASLKIKTEIVKEPDYTGEAAWAGGAKSGMGNFQMHCVPCHGSEGRGDGMLAEDLETTPRDLTFAGYLSQRSDKDLFQVISEGGASVGFSECMMPFVGRLNDEEIKNVIAYIRSELCKCKYEGN